jgi:hypothetical protein
MINLKPSIHCHLTNILINNGLKYSRWDNNAVSGGDSATNNTASGHPRRNVGTYKDGPSIIWQLPIDGESYNLTFSSTIVYEWINPVPAVANQGQVTKYHPNQKFPKRFSG